MDLAPVGRSGLQGSQTKPLQRDPDTLTQKRGATEGEERRRGGDKVTRGEKMEKEREGGNGRGSVRQLTVHQECRCDGWSSKIELTQTFSALSSNLEFLFEKKKNNLIKRH